MEKCCCCEKELGDIFECFEGKHYCAECFANEFFFCADCGGTTPIEFSNVVEHNRQVCENCNSRYLYCECCNNTVYQDDWNYDAECCNNCAENALIGSYHSTDVRYVGKSKKSWKNKWRGLGFELEIDRSHYSKIDERNLTEKLDENFGKHIFLEHDGSLENGFEIISHPHTIKEFYKVKWSGVLALCKQYGYQSHNYSTCGLHIHISRNMFGSTEYLQDNAIAKVIYFYEREWDNILKLSRRTNEQANQWANKYCVKHRKEIKKIKDCGRYFAVNNSNYKTVEFRLGRGTLNEKRFFAWIDFNLTLVRNSKKITWQNINCIELWLKGLNPQTIAELNEKEIFLNVDKGVNV